MRAKKSNAANRFGTKIEYEGVVFDSIDEKKYYQYLQQDPDIAEIVLQPKYEIIKRYLVICHRCKGVGRILKESTGNMNKCTLCSGEGSREKGGAIYTADFFVTYKNGWTETVDVKGFVQRDFPLRQKLFEIATGNELVVVEMKKKKWVRK